MRDALAAIARHGHQCDEHEAGLRACERLLSMDDLDANDEQSIRTARTNYAVTLDALADVRFVRFECEPAEDGWTLFNPTILARGDGFLAIVRSSNYRIVDGRYVIPESDGQTIRTKNLLCELGPSLAITRCRPISGPDCETTGYPVEGLEDCRLRPTANGVGVSATVRNVAPFDGRCRIATAELDVEEARFHSLRVIESAGAQEHEKNWMPLVGKAAWLYQCNREKHTLSVQERPDFPDEYCLLQHAPAHPLARGFRGGSQLVPWRGGWLGCVHEVAWVNGLRAYEHRFVWLSDALKLARGSRPFSFREPRAIEFAAGLAQSGPWFVVTFGVRDAEAWAVELHGETLWKLLRPL